MAKIPSPQTVIEKYLEDRERIKKIKRDCADAVAEIEKFQRNREDFLLSLEANNMEIFSFLVDLFINGRDGKAEKEKEKGEISLRQADIEKWLLAMLGKHGKGIMTDYGTVYKTRKESVTVSDWDCFVETNLLRPAALELVERFIPCTGDALDSTIQLVIEAIRHSAHLEFLNHAVNKSSVLEILGDADVKTGSRPNPPPAGIDYRAVLAVGVRKGK